MTTTKAPINDPATEHWLRLHGVDAFELCVVEIDLIDMDRSAQNQARKVPFIADTVDLYANAMLAGAVFPPVVLAKVGGKFVVMDGNHRVHSSISVGETSISAYVVNVTEAKRFFLTLAANSRNGEPPSDDDRDSHVMHFHNQFREVLSTKEIAALARVSAHRAEQVIRANEVLERCENKRLAARVPLKVLSTMRGIENDNVLNAFVGVVASSPNTTVQQATEAVRRIKAKRSEKAQLEQVASEVALLVPKAQSNKPKKGAKVDDVWKLNRALGTVLSCAPSVVGVNANGLKDELRIKVAEAIKHLEKIGEAL